LGVFVLSGVCAILDSLQPLRRGDALETNAVRDAVGAVTYVIYNLWSRNGLHVVGQDGLLCDVRNQYSFIPVVCLIWIRAVDR